MRSHWLKAGRLDDRDRANLAEMERRWRRATAVPADLVEAQSKATARSVQTWQTARQHNDWDAVAGHLEEVVSLAREQAAALRQIGYATPYDALLNEYEQGLPQPRLDELFDDVKRALPGLLDRAVALQRPPLVPRGRFRKADQLALVHELADRMGFDWELGRVDESAHPFTLGCNRDVRMTVRYVDWKETIFATIHELGHALYVLGLPAEPADQPVADDCGLSVHESQSLFFERLIGRSDAFIRFAAPLLQRHLHGSSTEIPQEWQPENLARLLRRIEPGNIRVRADELTYPFHVLLRYELEAQLVDGSLAVADLPTAWDEKMMEYLGRSTAGNFADGPMQDVHWFTGLFGYFPTYLAGAIIAAQLYAAAARELDIDALVEQGRFEPILGWLRKHVHGLGRLKSTTQLVSDATGEDLSANAYLDQLEARYAS